MRARFHALALLATAAALAAPASAPLAQGEGSAAMPFDAYVQLLAARARAEGVSEDTIARMTSGLTPNQRVIDLDRAQPGTPSSTGFPLLAPYIRTHVDRNRVAGGRQVYQDTRSITERIEYEYGVPGQVVIAIWGHETNYGGYQGDFDLARSLATLAWEGRRRDLFEAEFVDLLRIADEGFPRSTLVGSWAGAFGNPQFLPSIYLRLAKDGDGDGRADIWNSRADTLHSIASYFHDAGWRPGQPWGVEASLPAGFDVEAYASKIASPVCARVHERHSAWKTVAEWRALGVRPQQPIGDEVLTSLFQPDGPGTPAWLLTGNYRVILEYNCSNYYAMSVGLLADEIVR